MQINEEMRKLFDQKYLITNTTLGYGSGNFSQVLAGLRKIDGARVAIKFIDPKFSVCEVEILRNLSHSNIVQLYDYFEDAIIINQSIQSILVMECMDGGELLINFLSIRSYSENQCRRVAQNILGAINYCHFKGILHRDIKLDNLLLKTRDELSTVKLADFGIAVELPPDGYLETPVIYGSPRYVAPEVLLWYPYGRPADMWSFCISMYALLCGQFPFASDEEIMTPDFRLPEEELNRLSADARSFLVSILIFDPTQRLTALAALEHPWLTHFSRSCYGSFGNNNHTTNNNNNNNNDNSSTSSKLSDRVDRLKHSNYSKNDFHHTSSQILPEQQLLSYDPISVGRSPSSSIPLRKHLADQSRQAQSPFQEELQPDHPLQIYRKPGFLLSNALRLSKYTHEKVENTSSLLSTLTDNNTANNSTCTHIGLSAISSNSPKNSPH